MNVSLRVFLAGLVDYAGLFPPTALPLDETLRRYVRYRAGRDAWMLGRLIVPASKLGDLLPLARAAGAGRANPLPLSVLAGIGTGDTDAMAVLGADIRAIRRFREELEGVVRFAAIETKLPESLSASENAESIAEYIAMFAESLQSAVMGRLDLWVEAPPSPRRRSETAATVEGIRMAGSMIGSGASPAPGHETGPENGSPESGSDRARARVGYKLRSGGATPESVPSVDHVAFVLAACRDAAVPLKCTAGLHHAARRRAGPSGAESHGFLPVFGAAVLAHANGWPEERVASCLSEEDARSFVFGDDALSWRGDSVPVEGIERARHGFAIAFGSCSFDEPRDDLAALGWMEPIEDGGA